MPNRGHWLMNIGWWTFFHTIYFNIYPFVNHSFRPLAPAIIQITFGNALTNGHKMKWNEKKTSFCDIFLTLAFSFAFSIIKMVDTGVTRWGVMLPHLWMERSPVFKCWRPNLVTVWKRKKKKNPKQLMSTER